MPQDKIIETPAPLRGTLIEEWKTCGKKGCCCAKGQLHGPYVYRVYQLNGKRYKRYVPPDLLEGVMKRLDARRKWKAQNEQLRHLGRALSLAVGDPVAMARIIARMEAIRPGASSGGWGRRPDVLPE